MGLAARPIKPVVFGCVHLLVSRQRFASRYRKAESDCNSCIARFDLTRRESTRYSNPLRIRQIRELPARAVIYLLTQHPGWSMPIEIAELDLDAKSFTRGLHRELRLPSMSTLSRLLDFFYV